MKPLSKTLLQQYTQCPRLMWYTYHSGNGGSVFADAEEEEQFSIGNDVGAAALGFFTSDARDEAKALREQAEETPDSSYQEREALFQEAEAMEIAIGESVAFINRRGFSESEYRRCATETAEAMQNPGIRVIAEGCFYIDDVVVFIDFMERNPEENSWDLYEVKSSSVIDQVHAMDLLWQTFIIACVAGVRVRQIHFLKPARGSSIFMEREARAEDFCVVDDFSGWIWSQIYKEIPQDVVDSAFSFALQPSPPTQDACGLPLHAGCGTRCFDPYDCSKRDKCEVQDR